MKANLSRKVAASILWLILIQQLIVSFSTGILVGLYRKAPSTGMILMLAQGSLLFSILIVRNTFLRKIPTFPKESGERLSPARGARLFLYTLGLLYLFNFLGQLLYYPLSQFFGSPANPLDQMIEAGGRVAMICGIFLAPVLEEILFRKLLIDRLRPLGRRRAVLFSAVIFGLFHGNIPQIIYAIPLGIVLGLLYYDTGKLSYVIGLHWGINTVGLGLGVYALRLGPGAVFLLNLVVFLLILLTLWESYRNRQTIVAFFRGDGEVSVFDDREECQPQSVLQRDRGIRGDFLNLPMYFIYLFALGNSLFILVNH